MLAQTKRMQEQEKLLSAARQEVQIAEMEKTRLQARQSEQVATLETKNRDLELQNHELESDLIQSRQTRCDLELKIEELRGAVGDLESALSVKGHLELELKRYREEAALLAAKLRTQEQENKLLKADAVAQSNENSRLRSGKLARRRQ
uniref:Uncharacterized protein LOC113794459 n=1 Tax=Dermatophagoides pteronyssinus TaxID=6956 RepID=A0A6P6Y526_DERPT|nr:uncharacterized protein LOC113794459 [Dermatophagoides pteronyssinus]